MNNIDYDKLHSQLIKAVANNKGPEAVPEMKNVINAYLSQFSGQISGAVDDLRFTANDKKARLSGLSDNDVKQLQALAGKELNRLTKLIDSNFNPKRVNAIVQNAINQHVANATSNSTAQINRYFADLRAEENKVDRLFTNTDKLSKRLDDANDKLDQADKKFWYGIATTIIVTVCVCWLFL